MGRGSCYFRENEQRPYLQEGDICVKHWLFKYGVTWEDEKRSSDFILDYLSHSAIPGSKLYLESMPSPWLATEHNMFLIKLLLCRNEKTSLISRGAGLYSKSRWGSSFPTQAGKSNRVTNRWRKKKQIAAI